MLRWIGMAPALDPYLSRMLLVALIGKFGGRPG
jgi:hypothetical protein